MDEYDGFWINHCMITRISVRRTVQDQRWGFLYRTTYSNVDGGFSYAEDNIFSICSDTGQFIPPGYGHPASRTLDPGKGDGLSAGVREIRWK